MKRKEFLALVKRAETGSMLPDGEPEEGKAFEVLNERLSPFDGIALHKNRVIADNKSAITFIRYQAMHWMSWPIISRELILSKGGK
jgi:hypothetical protein